MSDRSPTTRATFVARENRFVVRARLDDGREVRAHLANTARLHDLLVPDAPLILVGNDDPRRTTAWSVTRAWDGTWVALGAGAAADLVADHLRDGGRLGDWAARGLRREVPHGGHRIDLALELADGRAALVEVKSLSRAQHGVAPLSWTPSTRGAAHLAALGDAAAAGRPAAVVFVVQRGDATALDIGAPADPTWVAAVRDARDRGVRVLAHACEVDVDAVRLGPPIAVLDSTSAVHTSVPGRTDPDDGTPRTDVRRTASAARR